MIEENINLLFSLMGSIFAIFITIFITLLISKFEIKRRYKYYEDDAKKLLIDFAETRDQTFNDGDGLSPPEGIEATEVIKFEDKENKRISHENEWIFKENGFKRFLKSFWRYFKMAWNDSIDDIFPYDDDPYPLNPIYTIYHKLNDIEKKENIEREKSFDFVKKYSRPEYHEKLEELLTGVARLNNWDNKLNIFIGIISMFIAIIFLFFVNHFDSSLLFTIGQILLILIVLIFVFQVFNRINIKAFTRIFDNIKSVFKRDNLKKIAKYISTSFLIIIVISLISIKSCYNRILLVPKSKYDLHKNIESIEKNLMSLVDLIQKNNLEVINNYKNIEKIFTSFYKTFDKVNENLSKINSSLKDQKKRR